MNRTTWAALLVVTTGCGGFSRREAEQVAEATTHAATEAYGSLDADRTSRSVQSNMTWTDTGTGFTVSGTLTSDGPEWFGTMEVDGEFTGDASSAEWSLDVVLVEVTVDDVTLDGDIHWGWSITVEDLTITLTSATQGTITATGKARGTGEIDTSSSISIGVTGVSASISGTVGDKEVDFETSFGWTL